MDDDDRINRPDDPKGRAVGDPLDHSRKEIFSAAGAAIAKLADKAFLPKVADTLIPLFLEGIQNPAGNNPYKDVVMDLQLPQKAALMFARKEQSTQNLCIPRQITLDKARMKHAPCPLDIPERLEQAGNTIANGVDAECTQLNDLVKEYLKDVLARDGKPLNPNNEAEKPQWEKETKLLAKIATLLIKDDNYLLHEEEIARYNDNHRFSDEPIVPDQLRHHLPEKFVVETNEKGNPKEFNVREICEREMQTIFEGKISSDLNLDGLDEQQKAQKIQERAQELAVLEFCREGLEGVLPWWMIDQDFKKHLDDMTATGTKFLDVDGKVVSNDAIVDARDQIKTAILSNFEEDFTRFVNQVETVKTDPEFQNKWYECKVRAVATVPTEAEARGLPAERDTHYQTDSESTDQEIRVAQWRHLVALADAVKTGLLFPGALTTKPLAELPTPFLVRLRAVRSNVNSPEFRDPSDTKNLARLWKMKALRNEFHLTAADPSVFGDSIVMPNGQRMPVPTMDQVNKQVADELKKWNVHGFPWTLAYIPRTNNEQDLAREKVLVQERVLSCSPADERRRQALDGNPQTNPALQNKLESTDPMVRGKAFRQQQDELRKRAADRRAQREQGRRQGGVMTAQQNNPSSSRCTHDLRSPGRDPYGNTVYNTNNNPRYDEDVKRVKEPPKPSN